MTEDEQLAERATRIDAAITKVRGRAQSTGGLVTLEVNAYKAITDLRIASHAMSSDPARLAMVIATLHGQACDEAEIQAEKAYTAAISGHPPTTRPTPATPTREELDDIPPLPITFSM